MSLSRVLGDQHLQMSEEEEEEEDHGRKYRENIKATRKKKWGKEREMVD